MKDGSETFSSIDSCLSRRQLLKCASLSGLSMLYGQSLTAEPPPVQDANPELNLVPARCVCGNSPTGGPYYRGLPSTLDTGTKALFDRDKLWDNGQEIVVRFLDSQGDAAIKKIQDKVREVAPEWSDYANVKFKFINQGKCHVTVNCSPFKDKRGNPYGYGLYNSFVGKDSLKYLNDVPTMNLLFDPLLETRFGSKAQANMEYRRVILHEFGHVVGLIHEHERPAGIKWNEKALYDYALRNWGWDCKTVREQIIHVEKGRFTGTSFDVRSIMEYPFEAGLATLNGKPFEAPNNFDLSALDKIAACLTYPKQGTLPLGETVLTSDDGWQKGEINQSGQVAFYRVRVAVEGNYKIETTGIPTLVGRMAPPDAQQDVILSAAESAKGQTNCELGLEKLEAKMDHFVQVRARKPLSDIGKFEIRLVAAN